jgi:hypothetical protein
MVTQIVGKYSGHLQVTRNLGGNDVGIDEGLVEVIDACWEAGYQTEYCCQGSSHSEDKHGATRVVRGYICFGREDGQRLLEGLPQSALNKASCEVEDYEATTPRRNVVVLRFPHSHLEQFNEMMLKLLSSKTT